PDGLSGLEDFAPTNQRDKRNRERKENQHQQNDSARDPAADERNNGQDESRDQKWQREKEKKDRAKQREQCRSDREQDPDCRRRTLLKPKGFRRDRCLAHWRLPFPPIGRTRPVASLVGYSPSGSLSPVTRP